MKLPLKTFDLIDKIYDKRQNPSKLLKEYSQYIDIYRDIKYSSIYDDCLLDMYKPINPLDKYPVVIYIHGGGYVAGDKHYRRGLAHYFSAKTNAIILSLEYKKSPDNAYLESLKELSSIFEYVINNKDKYKFDLDNLTIMGDSSGGCCALSLTALAFNKEYQNIVGVDIKLKPSKCILNCGFYTFDISDKLKKQFENVMLAITKNNPTDEYLYKCTSLNYLNSEVCPILFCHSEYDVFCDGQGEKLKNKLNELNIKYDEVKSNSIFDNHCYPLMWKGKKAHEFNNKVVEFIKK